MNLIFFQGKKPLDGGSLDCRVLQASSRGKGKQNIPGTRHKLWVTLCNVSTCLVSGRCGNELEEVLGTRLVMSTWHTDLLLL